MASVFSSSSEFPLLAAIAASSPERENEGVSGVMTSGAYWCRLALSLVEIIALLTCWNGIGVYGIGVCTSSLSESCDRLSLSRQL